MHEIKGNIWTAIGTVDALCVTTNGVVKDDDRLVMGAGIARDARDKYPGIDQILGYLVMEDGNIPHVCWADGATYIVSFPTKTHYSYASDLLLILKSAVSLCNIATTNMWQSVALPRPGCGHGRLKWESVKNALNPIFDDRFYIYYDK